MAILNSNLCGKGESRMNLHNGDERHNDTGWEIYLDGKWYAYSENGEVTVPVSFIHNCIKESLTSWKFYQIMKDVKEIKEIVSKDKQQTNTYGVLRSYGYEAINDMDLNNG